MARVSRKSFRQPKISPAPPKVYRACLYTRLSKEDSGHSTHDSIEMQEALLRQYVAARGDMEVAAVFCDNGATGTDFQRPAFEAMMNTLRRGATDCIVVKDLSRFGRNYIETGWYLERVFPLLNVRFVAVNDCYDTLYAEASGELAVSLKNIVNGIFAKDISRKSGTALRRKQENGEFIGSRPPYGYRKDPENSHRLTIDLETAPIVREIFRWRLEGLSYGSIAKKLNFEGLPCPTMKSFLRGEFCKKPTKILGYSWSPATIKAITENPAYAGHMAQGKSRRSLCEGTPQRAVERENWIIIPKTHPPLVSEETWNAVSLINQTAAGRV